MTTRNILVIEDNHQNRYLVRYILERHGYAVVEARNGIEGLNLASEQTFSLIILDIQLPKMDGYEVARRLRADSQLDGTPIMAVTSYAMVGDRERALDAGCNGYIEKPIDPTKFASQITELIEDHAGSPG